MSLPEEVAAGALLLRRWQPDDLEPLMAAIEASQAELQGYMPWAVNVDSTREDDFIRRSAEAFDGGTAYSYAVVERASGAIVGGCGVTPKEPGVMEIGYWTHSAYTGRGFATSAAATLTKVAFAEADTDTVRIQCDVANQASAAIPRKLGYTYRTEVEAPIVALRQTGRNMVWEITRGAYSAAP